MSAKNPVHTEPDRPTRVVVGSMPWSITWDDEEDWTHRKNPGKDDQRGYSDTIDYAIYMRTFMGRTEGEPASVSALQGTLIHEIIHVINHASGIDVQIEDIGIKPGPDLEEWITGQQAPVLLDVLRNNPDLLIWLLWKEF